ncbi:hypothetical protein EVAR_52756_1 [Eumeta japonica]|uniref:Uncharacterized protein n=1 Tax=Eumeta variegata TaxID=151549 RepID=A0A4C1XCV6_EUMVA|nr:hypothetical protein EVAR_52756_1 [Eumeta japonica]
MSQKYGRGTSIAVQILIRRGYRCGRNASAAGTGLTRPADEVPHVPRDLRLRKYSNNKYSSSRGDGVATASIYVVIENLDHRDMGVTV